MSVDLLRLSAPQHDTAAWCADIRSLCERYGHSVIKTRLHELTVGGYITDSGTPRVGWLTEKGRQALAPYGS